MQVRNKFDDPARKVTQTGQSVFLPPINAPSDTRPNAPDQAIGKQFTHNKVTHHGGVKRRAGWRRLERVGWKGSVRCRDASV